MTVQHAAAMIRPAPQDADLRSYGVTPETSEDAAAVDALVMTAFGPGRYAKTAERLRETATLACGFVVREAGRVIGSVRLWRVRVGDAPALFLGPITVDAASRRAGLGADLTAACIAEARTRDVAGVLLVGDAAYFERLGFVHAPEIRLPGPVDRRRVLWLAITAEPPVGLVNART